MSSSCDTTHCIAGWNYLHPRGKELEDNMEPMLVYLLGTEAHSHFFDNNKDAREYLESVLSEHRIEL